MKKVGIIGNIGSGKSYFSSLLREKGNVVIDLDSVAKSFYHLEQVQEEMKYIFGNDIYIFGELDKEKLSEIIFNNNSKREQLEKYLKRFILDNLYAEFYYQEYTEKLDVIYVESATMIKTGLYKEFDKIIIIDADPEMRMKHVVENRGISERDFIIRNYMQLKLFETIALLEKYNISYDIIYNDFTDKIKKYV